VVCGDLFTANNELEGTGGANGIYSDEGAQKVLITANRFERHNISAIFFTDIDQDPPTPPVLQQDILIEGNTSVDDLSFAVVYNRSRVRLTGNDISARVGDEKFPGPASAIRIGARDHDVVVDRNRIRVTNSGEPGREGSAPTSVLVLENKVQHAELLGIDVSASGVREYGTAGTENTWQENVGATADPRGICSAPAGDDQPAGDGRHHGKQQHHGQRHQQHRDHKQPRQDPGACIRPSWRF
jgi:hypothetical protein